MISARPTAGRRRGLTRLELIYIVSVISVLAGILHPAIVRVKAAANASSKSASLKSLAEAMHNYDDAVDLTAQKTMTTVLGFLARHSVDTAAIQSLEDEFTVHQTDISALIDDLNTFGDENTLSTRDQRLLALDIASLESLLSAIERILQALNLLAPGGTV
jgi:Tfp pilus assembly protein PilE